MIRARHLRLAARWLGHRFRELHPFEVQAVLLNACNLRCDYCRCPEIKTRLLTTRQWVETIRDLAALGTMRIKFQGGEPTLRSDFRDLCAEVQRAGVLSAVITNGIEIARRPELLDYLDEIVVSLDSATAAHHDRVRGAGSHAAGVRALDAARERGIRTYVNMVVTRESLGEVEPMLEFCEARKTRLNPQPIMFHAAFYDQGARPVALSTEEIRAMHARLVEWQRQGRGLMFSAHTYALVRDWPDYGVATTRSDGPSPCMAGRYYVNIEANGDVLPCIQHGASLVPKNVVADGVEAAVRHVRRHDCGNCWSAYLIERKALFALRPHALREVVRRG